MKIKFKIFFPREFMDHHLQDLKHSVPMTSKRIPRPRSSNRGEISKYVKHDFQITKGAIQVEVISAYDSENQNCETDGLSRHLMYVSSSFHSLPLIGLSLFYTQTRSVVFSSLPVNLMFHSLNRPPFVLPRFLHIAVQTQKASLAPIIVIGG